MEAFVSGKDGSPWRSVAAQAQYRPIMVRREQTTQNALGYEVEVPQTSVVRAGMRSMRALADKQILIILSALTLILAAGSLLLGLLAGYPILLQMGLAEFAAMLTEIPAGSAVVALVVTPLPFAVGVGLLWKGICESLVTSVVPGTVLASSYRLIPGDTQDEYVVYSSVRYVLDGVPRKSEGPHHEGLPSEAAAKQRLAALHAGDPVQVYYRQGEPGVVYLDAPPERTRTVLAVGAWITFTGLVATFLNGVVLAG